MIKIIILYDNEDGSFIILTLSIFSHVTYNHVNTKMLPLSLLSLYRTIVQSYLLADCLIKKL